MGNGERGNRRRDHRTWSRSSWGRSALASTHQPGGVCTPDRLWKKETPGGWRERFFLPGGGSCTCGRRKRQAGDNNVQPDAKFFGLFGNNNQHCGSCCYNQGFSAGSSQGGFSHGSTGGCQCDYSKTFTDQYGNIHGACRRADNSGRTWCYTTGWGNSGCGDLQSSSRFPSNPWSYRACSTSG